MISLNIKSLSVNDAWKGKRFKTDKYKSYERHLMMILPRMSIPDGNLSLYVEWGFSYSGRDIDNPLKPFIDILQKKYGFNDNRIYELVIKKKSCKRGKDYINFEISECDV